MSGNDGVLTGEQVGHFLERGFVTVRGAFDPASARDWLDHAWVRFGYDRDDPGSWAEPRIHLGSRSHVDAREFAPAAWRAAAELIGGEDRMELPWLWGDSFIANLGVGRDQPWEPPSPAVGGWHKDGDFFRHFLDSPEQALLTFVLWTDMLPKGGGTFVAADSVPVVARFLAEHPEGVLPHEFPYADLIGQCHDFVEMTGKVGDVVLLHPFTLHATSQNVLGVSRIITNPGLALRAPMNFGRPDAGDLSLTERAVLRALRTDRLDFAPSVPREKVVPDRIRKQQARAAAEDARLGVAGLALHSGKARFGRPLRGRTPIRQNRIAVTAGGARSLGLCLDPRPGTTVTLAARPKSWPPRPRCVTRPGRP
ncbi:MAG TPA: hypothetical protein VGG75_04040 [Trebonia sp.]|jgi:hypothetical protein